MAGACGRTYRIDPRLDPAPCNALEQTASGLLVPRTVLSGIAPGGAVGTARSVDVDVTAPAPAVCPEAWTVGARLTPVSGQRNAGTLDLRTVAQSTPFDVPSSDITLPEAGVYELTADLLFIATWNFTGRHVAAIIAQWFNVTTGTNVPGSNRWWVHDDPGGNVGTVGLASVWENVVVRALVSVPGPTTFRLRGIRGTGNGSAATTANVQHAIQQNGGASQNLIVWRKVAD